MESFEESEYNYFRTLELATPETLSNNQYTVIRCDGNHFHSYARLFLKPFDPFMHYCLDRAYYWTVNDLFKGFWACIYSQSDEVTIVLYPKKMEAGDELCDIPYGRKSKLMSIIPSRIATAFIVGLYKTCQKTVDQLYKLLGIDSNFEYNYERIIQSIGFDCRIFQTSKKGDVDRCLTWRRTDAINNLKQMVLQNYKSQKQLQGKKPKLILSEDQVLNDIYMKLPTLQKRGLFISQVGFIHEFHPHCQITEQYLQMIIQMIIQKRDDNNEN